MEASITPIKLISASAKIYKRKAVTVSIEERPSPIRVGGMDVKQEPSVNLRASL
jgi:hypothetical protein